MFSFFKKKSSPPSNGLIARSATELLDKHTPLLNSIRQQLAVPETYWEKIYLAFIHNFANLVQQLPASESHHHANVGGLLTHSLETGLHALKLRKAKMFPIGASSETIEKEKELWSYAVFTAALLHDVGKPLTDQIITLVAESSLIHFNPVTERMKPGDIYRLEFKRGRKYRSHENVPLILVSSLIPKEGLDWITNNTAIFEEWTLCLTGRKSEAESIGDLITQADQISTAQNLTGTDNIPTPAAKTTPLYKRLVTALTYLLDQNELPLNRQGAAGWTYDDKVWLVSKRVIDAIRAHMSEEGQSGIPSDNSRIMDELTQHGILIPTHDNKAVWKEVIVHVDSWQNKFSLLCIPLQKLWPDVSAWPEQNNSIQILTPDDQGASISPPEQTDRIDNTEQEALSNHQIKEDTSDGNEHISDVIDLPLPPGIVLEENNASNEDTREVEIVTKANSNIVNNNKIIPVEIQDQNKIEHCGQSFINWLCNGVADGSISVNQIQAMVHTVGKNKDLILVSPKIFRYYGNKKNLDYEKVQRDFLSLDLHKKNGDINIWSFKTISKRKNKKDGRVSGVVIDDAETKLGVRLPPGNTNLKLRNNTK